MNNYQDLSNMLFMTNAQLKYTSFGILTIFIKLIQTTPSDVVAFDLFFTPLYDTVAERTYVSIPDCTQTGVPAPYSDCRNSIMIL